MARHRSDPRGGARITLAVTTVVVALALLAVGAYAMVDALRTKSGATDAASAGASSSSSADSSPSARPPVLTITVTGKQCDIFVSTPGNSDILVNRTFQHGETFIADQPRLQVAISDGGAVEIRVNGVRRPAGKPGQQLSFIATNDGSKPT
ncbi:hypothetical protein [Actinoallomurus sp. NPDC050550]|uniref:hypothetical protein n=1 Tax=Actinoallomurus sp. NPDC050550 TaxID=3154937 RepID=UPI0034013546